MKQALLAVSFGTSVPSARESINRVEQALRETLPDYDFFRAFTSPTIRRILAKRGEIIQSTGEALEQLAKAGYEDVIVQPTHLLCGIEYDRIQETVRAFEGSFSRLTLGKPLAANDRDLRVLADCAAAHFLPEEGALLLMGHGTSHFANTVYPALQTIFRLSGIQNAFVGTVEGWPTLDEMIGALKQGGYRSVTLAPLMLVAGDHACNDMAGDGEDSWKSRLEKEGFAVHCRLEGLGLFPEVQALYRLHLEELVHGL